MSYGLRIWNSSGGLELDITDRITRFFAAYSYSIPAFGSVTVSIPGYSTDGTWFFFLTTGAPQVRTENVSGGVRLTNVFNSSISGTLHVLRA